MDGEERKTDDSLRGSVTQLLATPQRVGFYRAVELLDEDFDVDDADDLARLEDLLRDERARAAMPATTAALRALRL